MGKIRVLVVDDSLTVRKHLVGVLASNDDFEVVGEAGDGQSAIELCRELRPDVITLDMMLPGLTGLEATEYIMAHHPTPILIVSASVNRGELFHTYDALAAGAVDVLDKADAGTAEDWDERFLSAVRVVSRIKVITHLRGRLKNSAQTLAPPKPAVEGAHTAPRVIGIGASTGGPGALAQVLSGIAAPCPLPILIVLHIGAPFAAALADWLDGQTGHRVSCARGGERLKDLGGRVVLAPADRHLVVRDGALRLLDDAPVHSCIPSVDVLFESMAAELGASAMACLLTGMGRDGARGLLAIRTAGGFTVAQDEATSVVYGMPREAAVLGAAESILAITRIGPVLGRIATSSSRRDP